MAIMEESEKKYSPDGIIALRKIKGRRERREIKNPLKRVYKLSDGGVFRPGALRKP